MLYYIYLNTISKPGVVNAFFQKLPIKLLIKTQINKHLTKYFNNHL